jgi:uncharacterized protein (DUF1499 family)
MRRLAKWTVFIVALAIVGGIVASQFSRQPGPGGFWIEALSRFGALPADILAFPGFDKLERRPTGNDALVCPKDRCKVAVDIEPPVFDIPATELLARLRKIALVEARTIELKTAPEDNVRADFQQASATFRFPDIISAEIIGLAPQRSTLSIWSRSVVGRKDFGVNRARVERWLKALQSAS